MRSILCFGDSNTYGIDCIHGTRYPRSSRWSGILQDLLGEQYDVIEEGLGGRNTIWSDPLAVGRTGIDMLPWLLESHKPLDLVILSLATNVCRTHLVRRRTPRNDDMRAASTMSRPDSPCQIIRI